MAYSYVDLAGSNGQQNFNFSIPYLSASHLTVTIDSVLTTAWSLTSTFVLRLDSALTADATVRIRRTTPFDEPVVDFENGSTLGESDLDLAILQILYVQQELEDATSVSGLADAIIACATSAAAALVSENNAETAEIAAEAAQAAAEAALAAALIAETNAELAETNAETAETNAELAETNAEAAQVAAAASAAAAAASATAAQTAETNAETAETNAETAQAAAEAARDAALTAETNAELAETNAETAETNAETAETNAEAAQAAAEAALADVEAIAAGIYLDNAIINPCMEIWQRGTAFAAIASAAYAADRWRIGYANDAVVTVNRSTSVPTVAQAGVAFNYSYEVDVTTADAAIGAAQYAYVGQKIEGHNWRHFAQRALVLSFWVYSTKTGTHCVFVGNSGTDRSYIGTYTVNASNTWEYKTVQISASPSAGTWDYTTGVGAHVGFVLASGTDFHTTAGAWQTGNYLATNAQVNCLDNTANFFRFTGVKLEVGTVASPLALRPIQQEFLACQRYYENDGGPGCIFSGDVTNPQNYYHSQCFNVAKRTGATMSYGIIGVSGFPAAAPGASLSSTGGFTCFATANATVNGGYFHYSWAASAEL